MTSVWYSTVVLRGQTHGNLRKQQKVLQSHITEIVGKKDNNKGTEKHPEKTLTKHNRSVFGRQERDRTAVEVRSYQ